jgi:small subunit ribosomal protein S20
MLSDSCPAPARPASCSHHQPSPEGVSPKVQAVANIKSQIKRNKQNEGRRLRNKAVRSELKTRQKRAITAAEQGSEDTVELTRLAIKRLDKAASKGVIHKNQAARRKSRLVKHIAELEAAAAS